MSAIALLEVLDRDGHVRQSQTVHAWPLRVGRALDNDLVLDDTHVAAHHLSVDADASGVFLSAGDSINGVSARGQHFGAGERIAVGDRPLRFEAGDSYLCLRLAEHALEPERPLRRPRTRWHSVWPTLVMGAAVLAVLMFGTWLDTDPDDLTRSLGSMLMGTLTFGLVWCAGWALLSKIFSRRSHFWWHVRVLLLAVLVIKAGGAAVSMLAFSLSWPWVSDFGFVFGYAVVAAMLYFHALGVEARRPRRMREVALALFVVGTGASMWFNFQARDQLGEELYMNHLFPPALRLARPVDATTFVQDIAPLQARLDAKAKQQGADGDADDEE